MPADYHSTARALSLPTSPAEPLSPSDDDTTTRPLWSHLSAGRRNSTPLPESASYRDKIIHRATGIVHRIDAAWKKMNWLQRLGSIAAVLGAMALGLGFMIFTGQIFRWLTPVAGKWEHSILVFLGLWFCVFFVSFPPLVGWSTFGTIAGFIFGVWKGWFLYVSASVVGSTCSLIVSRTVPSKFVHRLMERDKRFAALSLTLKYDGLKLLCMIRLCPLPYSICNGAVSTFPTVDPLMYGLATAIIAPKMFVAVFIGSRLRLLSEKNEEMSAGAKAVNICSIIITVAVGAFTGWYIYRRTLARAKELDARERAAERADIRQSLENDPASRGLHAFSDDLDTDGHHARDEEERIGFNDFDDDNVDLDIEDDSGNEHSPERRKIRTGYRDEFTDNESDIFRDGDGADGETYNLHSHVRTSSGSSQRKPPA